MLQATAADALLLVTEPQKITDFVSKKVTEAGGFIGEASESDLNQDMTQPGVKEQFEIWIGSTAPQFQRIQVICRFNSPESKEQFMINLCGELSQHLINTYQTGSWEQQFGKGDVLMFKWTGSSSTEIGCLYPPKKR